MQIAFAILGGLALVAFAYGLWVFNRMVSLRARSRGAWSDIDVQLKRRWDLVPSLVETVRGYASHERDTLERATAQRARAAGADAVEQRASEETALTGAIGSVLLLVEAYPDLKADDLYRSLHEQLVEVEDHLQSARRYYNAVVRDLNTKIDQFPSSLVAAVGGISRRPYFEIGEASHRAAPSVAGLGKETTS